MISTRAYLFLLEGSIFVLWLSSCFLYLGVIDAYLLVLHSMLLFQMSKSDSGSVDAVLQKKLFSAADVCVVVAMVELVVELLLLIEVPKWSYRRVCILLLPCIM